MIDEILRNNLIIREWLNGGLLPLNLSLVVVIGLFLWESWIENTRQHLAHRYGPTAFGYLSRDAIPREVDYRDVAGVQTACALLWIFVSDAMRAGIVWWLLISARTTPPPVGVITTGMVLVNVGFFVAGIIGIAATMRCIYQFTPEDRKHVYWTRSLLITLAFQIGSQLLK